MTDFRAYKEDRTATYVVKKEIKNTHSTARMPNLDPVVFVGCHDACNRYCDERQNERLYVEKMEMASKEKQKTPCEEYYL